MSILDIKEKNKSKQIRKSILVYLIVAFAMIAVDKIYAIFGHGVSSDAMTWMFLYPIVGGSLFFILIEFLVPGIDRIVGYRIFYNIYNSGIAVLTVASFTQGILEIAGTNSPYLTLYYRGGWLLIGSGLILLVVLVVKHKR